MVKTLVYGLIYYKYKQGFSIYKLTEILIFSTNIVTNISEIEGV